ncbi:MAG: methyltransferase domain-containing protein [Patescibacteria group bacterium]
MPNFYDFNAKSWDASRQNAWGEFEFAKDLLRSKKILDAGCGNGRLNFWLKANKFSGAYFGVDSSKKLIALAKKNFPYQKFTICDLRELTPEISRGLTGKLPDAVFCIAVLHHLENSADQKKALQNLYDSLRPGGKIFLTTWNLWQPRFWKYFFRQKLRELEIPFAGKSARRVYAFTKSELRELFASAGFQKIKIFYARHSQKSNFLRGRNLIVLAEK